MRDCRGGYRWCQADRARHAMRPRCHYRNTGLNVDTDARNLQRVQKTVCSLGAPPHITGRRTAPRATSRLSASRSCLVQHRGVVVVTGASTGIGAATVRELASRGYRVFGTVRRARDAATVEADGGVPLTLDV